MATASQNCVVRNFDSIISDIAVDGRANASLMVQLYYFVNAIASFVRNVVSPGQYPL